MYSNFSASYVRAATRSLSPASVLSPRASLGQQVLLATAMTNGLRGTFDKNSHDTGKKGSAKPVHITAAASAPATAPLPDAAPSTLVTGVPEYDEPGSKNDAQMMRRYEMQSYNLPLRL